MNCDNVIMSLDVSFWSADKMRLSFIVTHLVMRIKLLNDAGVAAESPPSQHEQIFDLSQVIRSVGVELWRNTYIVSILFFCTRYQPFFFMTGLSSPGAAVEADCQQSTLNSSCYPVLSAWRPPETEPAKLQSPANRRREKDFNDLVIDK